MVTTLKARYLLIFLGIVSVIAIACGTDAAPSAGPATEADFRTEDPGGKTPTAPIVSHGGPVEDYVSLVDNLRAAGATVDPAGTVSQPFFAPQGQSSGHFTIFCR